MWSSAYVHMIYTSLQTASRQTKNMWLSWTDENKINKFFFCSLVSIEFLQQ